MKIRFSSDGDLPLNKILKLHNLTIIARSLFEKDGKYYPQVFLDECLYEYDKIDISEGIDINKTNVSKEYKICHYWHILDKNFKYEPPYLCNGCHDLMKKAMNFNDVAIVSIKGNDYRIYAISIMNNSSLNEKVGSL